MLILAIETSCDETAAAIVEDGSIVLSSVIASAKDIFARTTGVIPEEAARRQVECMIPVLDECLRGGRSTPADIDALAVTRGPGLLGSLLVGTAAARTVAAVFRKRIIGVHHTLGHLSSTWLRPESASSAPDEPPCFPIITLSASGGHTDLWYRTSHTHGVLLGSTRDDAAGEAFDKGASLLGLPYPGGPSLSRCAEGGDATAFPFPTPLRGDPTLEFSFSGLKTALKYTLRDLSTPLTDAVRRDLAASYQNALVEHLTDRVLRALDHSPDPQEIHVVGGVSANAALRAALTKALLSRGLRLRTPALLSYCTDNAAMIGAAAHFLALEREEAAFAPFTTEATIPLATVFA
ncbi:MAG: tRNA (adenosine(37)-N6)-threonylcarbamoyltransferase complex transferase subunit TsaD [Candidatus Peregrinibacteria bacterium]|nr:tRNA (adenosine(37)-N6)-threonylcarbamoyltransferase complex transferase subunit TsaD [Candidatus Peregrinibacteria bacterium]